MKYNFTPEKVLALSIILFSAFLNNSCYPGGADNVQDLDVVATANNPNYNFANASTYVLPPRIVKITGEDPKPEDTLSGPSVQTILNQIKTNMTSYGYTEVKPGGAAPDLIVQSYIARTTVIGAYYPFWWDYWGWYPWGSWGYPWGGGWYPVGLPVVYSYTIGDLIITISDPKAEDIPNKHIGSVWLGSIKGVDNGTTSNTSRAVAGIDQAFVQSPYLKTN
ncbi:DUF4136 domain-containing protein [Solitalea koreensis]|uniref:DUF4136 domain-containing protein n=1 Tax=Solitalea koreensis TaxID=543615 RepID=A0A521DHN0_9SPHI|nr:DUF4136 domain-containing protein [Solitalea koreensis]SMO71146.1 protein of unknown function [Solitalea koreensis]